jgi:two-component system, NarL family, response regulator LiaR
MDGKIRVLIADDHPIVRRGLNITINAQEDMELVAEASNGEEAVTRIREHRPEVIIMDLKMPGKDGLAAIKEVTESMPGARILVLTSFSDDDNVFAAIKAGAVGFLLKDSPPDQLLDAIRAVHRGEGALHSSIARKLMTEIKRPPDRVRTDAPLTPRELEVLQYIAQGLSNREIADKMSVSIRTVTTHVGSILDKLHLANRTKAALYAVEQGLVPRPDGESR